MFETPSETQVRLQKLLQEQSDFHARQHRDTRSAFAENWSELQRVLSAHRSEQYRHYYKVERELSEVVNLLREHLALKDARIAALETLLQQAQEQVAQQQALLAQLLASGLSPSALAPASAIVADLAARLPDRPIELEDVADDGEPLVLASRSASDLAAKPRAVSRPPVKLPAFDMNINSIAQLVLDSGAASLHVSSEDEEREPTARLDARELADSHAGMDGKRGRGGFKLPRLRKAG